MRWWSSVLFFNGFLITIIVNVVCYKLNTWLSLWLQLSECTAELKSVVQVCRERKEGNDPDMSVLLGLRCEFTLCLLLLYIFMIWGDHKLFSRVVYLRGWHSRVWPFKWKLFPMLKEVLHFLSLWMKPQCLTIHNESYWAVPSVHIVCIFNVVQGDFT